MCLAQAVSLYQCWTEHEQSAVAGTGPAEAATNKAVYDVLVYNTLHHTTDGGNTATTLSRRNKELLDF